MINPNIRNFIKKRIIKREESFFKDDIESNYSRLSLEIKNNSVLVIGGAGTIGSNYIKSILKYKPAKLCVVDINENGLTELTRDLRSSYNQFIPKEYITYPMDFGSDLFRKMFLQKSPFNIVANFAAHKHVRSEKDNFSIESMINNNVFKAIGLLDLLAQNKPDHFFCVSTDKAANPVNVMGASKKLMEDLIMLYSEKFKITTARFANVAFSNGSLLDGYLKRLSKNQPISCPIDVKRYFVSPEESGEICMLTCILGNTGEIFFPKLNQNQLVNFKDITIDFFDFINKPIVICQSEEEAKMISSEMLSSDPYPIFFFSTDTSGEKLFEEFFSKDDQVNLKNFEGLGIIDNNNKIKKIKNKSFTSLKKLINSNNMTKKEIISLLKTIIPGFKHIETGKTLDQKM